MILLITISSFIIDFFVDIWYCLLIAISLYCYVSIFLYFKKVSSHKKITQLLDAPNIPLRKAMRRYADADKELYSFLGYDNNENLLSLNHKWIKSFFEVCHWCGYQVLIRKDSKSDIEDSSSIAYDEKFLKDLSKDFGILNELSVKVFNSFKKEDNDLKSKFEL